MKVVLFQANYIEHPGGAEKYLSDLARTLRRRGHGVVIAGSSPVYEKLVMAFYHLFMLLTGKGWRRITLVRVPRDLGGSPVQRVRLRELLPWTRSHARFRHLLCGADVIYSKNEVLDLALLRIFLPSAAMKKVIIGVHSAIFVDDNTARTVWGRLHEWLYSSAFYKSQLKACGAIHVLNASYRDLLVARYDVDMARIAAIPNPLPDEVPKPRMQRQSAGLPLRLLFAQRLSQQKGVDYLADVVKMLAETQAFPDLCFTIAGPSGEYESLAVELDRMYPNVVYRGYVSAMSELYAEHDIAIVPSRWEMFPYSVLEAQAAGLPVLAFDIPGSRDIVVDGKTGWLVPPGDVVAMADVVRQLVAQSASDPSALREMGRRAADLASSRFGANVVTDRLTNLFRRVAEN